MCHESKEKISQQSSRLWNFYELGSASFDYSFSFFLDMTSDSEMLPATQTSAGSKVSPTLHQMRDQEEQSEIFQSSDDDIIRKFEEYRSAQQDFDNRESSVKIDTAKLSSKGENNVLFCFSTI